MSVPIYPKPCLAPSTTNNTVNLVGIAPAREGILEVYSLDITNINTPTARLVTSQTNVLDWSSSQALACFPYPGLDTSSAATPFAVFQYGVFKTFFTNINPGGIEAAIHFPGVAFNSPKTFAFTGASGQYNWFMALTNSTYLGTGSAWTGVRLNSAGAMNSFYNFGMSMIPSANPLLAVGTIETAGTTPTMSPGYTIVFDYLGGGVIYSSTGSLSTLATPSENIINLSNPTAVSMSGITLTTNAIPVTMGNTAYILDQGKDGSTVVYSIKPSVSATLAPHPIKGNVPKFSTILAATVSSSQIVTYSSSNGLVPIINSLETTTGTWSGLGLIAPILPPISSSGPLTPTNSRTNSGSLPSSSNSTSGDGNGESKMPLGAIVGGVVGGLVVIALVAFLFIRNRRKKQPVPVTQKPDTVDVG
ncbi:hypothetical protein BGX33_007839, partial [Mortierella sp. NVP41]